MRKLLSNILMVMGHLLTAATLLLVLFVRCSDKAEGAVPAGATGQNGGSIPRSAQALPSSESGDWCVLCIDKVDLRYQQFKDRRDPYTPDKDEQWGSRVGLDWDLQLLRYGFWRNDVHAEQLQDGRVKTVGWHWFLGLRLPPLRSEIFHEHHSQHVLDQAPLERDGDDLPQGFRKFPVEDSYGVRVHLYLR